MMIKAWICWCTITSLGVLLAFTAAVAAEKGEVELIHASPVPTPLQAAPYRTAFVAHEYRVREPWAELEEGDLVRIVHQCLADGRPVPCPSSGEEGSSFSFELEPLEIRQKEIQSQYFRDDLEFHPDTPYFLDVRSASRKEARDRFDYNSSLTDKALFLAHYWGSIETAIIGDSRAEAAIAPEFLGEQGSSFNLSTPSAGIETLSLISATWVRPMPKVKRVIIGISPRMLGEHWEDGSIRGIEESNGYERDAEHGFGVTRRDLLSLSDEDQTSWLERRAFPYGPGGSLDFDFKHSGNGFKADARLLNRIRVLSAKRDRLQLCPDRIKALKELVDKNVDAGLQVWLVTCPTHRIYQEAGWVDDDGVHVKDYLVVQQILADAGAEEFLDGITWGFRNLETDDFSNPDHLSRQGAGKFTRWLKERMELVRDGEN